MQLQSYIAVLSSYSGVSQNVANVVGSKILTASWRYESGCLASGRRVDNQGLSLREVFNKSVLIANDLKVWSC